MPPLGVRSISGNCVLDPDFVDLLCLAQHVVHWIFVHLQYAILPCIRNTEQWLHELTWQKLLGGVRLFLDLPSEWPVYTFYTAKQLLVTHTHAVHAISFAVFIGPIAILIPLLLLHELVVVVLFQLSFIFHGLRGPIDDHYTYLTSVFDDVKGPIFSSVDRWGTTYNQLTSEYWPLVFIRLVCLGVGTVALCRIIHDLPVMVVRYLS